MISVGLRSVCCSRTTASKNRLSRRVPGTTTAFKPVNWLDACLVAAQNRIPLVQAWGGGEVASADGLRFVVPVRTLHAGPNPKYFGYEHGVTYYNLMSNQFTGLNAIVVPGTLRDSLFLLALVLEQSTEL